MGMLAWAFMFASMVDTLFTWAGSIEPLHEKTFMPCANNKGADQPAHPHSLIRAFVVRCLDSIIPLLVIAEIPRP